MHTKQPVYAPGDLLLDWFDKFRDRSVPPGIVPVARVEGTSEFYYRLFVPVFLPGIRRKGLEAVESWSIRLPCIGPCHFPADFSAACLVSRFAYCSRLWCIDELGQLLANKTGDNGDGPMGGASQVMNGAGLRGCGYTLREIRRGRPIRWAWAANGAGALLVLKTWAAAAEAESPPDASLPDLLVEQRLQPWPAVSSPEAYSQFHSGGVFCALQSGEWIFHTFAERSKSGRVITTNGELRRRMPVCPPPSAFPKEILALLQSIHLYGLLPGGEVWIARANPRKTPLSGEEAQLPDLPNNGATVSAMNAHQMGRFSLYYTCDLIHWRSRLSAVLEEIASRNRLTPSHTGMAQA